MNRVIWLGRTGLLSAVLLASALVTNVWAVDRRGECGAECVARARAYTRQQQTGGPMFGSDTTRVGPQSRPTPLPSGTGTSVTPNR